MTLATHHPDCDLDADCTCGAAEIDEANGYNPLDPYARLIRCECCSEFLCLIHEQHYHDCPCPDIDGDPDVHPADCPCREEE